MGGQRAFPSCHFGKEFKCFCKSSLVYAKHAWDTSWANCFHLQYNLIPHTKKIKEATPFNTVMLLRKEKETKRELLFLQSPEIVVVLRSRSMDNLDVGCETLPAALRYLPKTASWDLRNLQSLILRKPLLYAVHHDNIFLYSVKGTALVRWFQYYS